MTTKYVCEKHPKADYIELHDQNGDKVLICGWCARRAAHEAQMKSIRETPGVLVEELTFKGEIINDA